MTSQGSNSTKHHHSHRHHHQNTRITSHRKLKEDYLDEDPIISDQQWFSVSFATITEQLKKDDIHKLSLKYHISEKKMTEIIEDWLRSEEPRRGFKIRGVDGTRDGNESRCKSLREVDQYFHVFSGQIGKWLTFGQNPTTVEEQHYYEDQLNELVKGHKENAIRSKEHYNKRKAELMEKAIIEGRPDTQKELASKEESIQAVEARVDTTKDQIKAYHEKLGELQTQLLQDESKFKQLLEKNPDYKLGELANPTKPVEYETLKTSKVINIEESTNTKIV